jgi:hypothetical protein
LHPVHGPESRRHSNRERSQFERKANEIEDLNDTELGEGATIAVFGLAAHRCRPECTGTAGLVAQARPSR